MSLPQTDQEWAQYHAADAASGLTENVVSTACPRCQTRFALVAKFSADGWRLRCTRCGWTGEGELKTGKQETP